jgi:Domain of unknown function (DUF4357)
MTATSIRLFLVDGTPDGLKLVEKSNWTGQALMFSRHDYARARERTELRTPGVYVLFGPSSEGVFEHRIYVGEADAPISRIDGHLRDKEFWTKAIVFTSKDASLNKAHVRFLEARLLRLAGDVKRAEIENGTAPGPPPLSETDRADMESFLEDMLLLYPVLGLRAFERVEEQPAPEERLTLAPAAATAEARDTPEGFVVFADALARRDITASLRVHGQNVVSLRERMLADGLLVEEADGLRLTRDYVFSSPSLAAAFLLGTPISGRDAWRNSAGVTLKEIQAAQVEAR